MNAAMLNDTYITNPTAIMNVVIYVDDLRSAIESFERYLTARFSHREGTFAYHFVHMSRDKAVQAMRGMRGDKTSMELTQDDYIVYLETQIALILDRYIGIPIHVIFVFDNRMQVKGAQFYIESYLAYLADLQTFPYPPIKDNSPLQRHAVIIRDASIVVWANVIERPILTALSKRHIPVVSNIPKVAEARLRELGLELEDAFR